MDAIKVKNHQISILAREIRLAEEISERTELRLANAGLADKVSALRALTTHRFEGRPNRRQIARRSRTHVTIIDPTPLAEQRLG
jgi:hypothetical protein